MLTAVCTNQETNMIQQKDPGKDTKRPQDDQKKTSEEHKKQPSQPQKR